MPYKDIQMVKCLFSSIFIAPDIDFSIFLRYIFHVPVSLCLIVGMVFIINHRNKLFLSLVFRNVRNFPDVIAGS